MASGLEVFLNIPVSSMTGVGGGSSSSSRASFPRTSMEIRLDSHYKAKVYNSGDAITGSVTIAPLRDISFDLFEIVLVGTTRTNIDNNSAMVHASHTFLQLDMPIDAAAYPVPRILKASKVYTLPVHYVVPHHLAISACSHSVSSPHVHDHHTMLPPTMGNNSGRSLMVADWERDDMVPDMAAVEYYIRARIYRETPKKDGSDKKSLSNIVEAVHLIRILPASMVDPPLHVSAADRLYKLQSSKTIRRGLFARSKMGTVTAMAGDESSSAPTPAPIVLRPDAVSATPTKAHVQLRFAPAQPDCQPPRITSWSAKLTSYTHYSAAALATFPNMGDGASNGLSVQWGTYSTSVSLGTTAIKDHTWEARVDVARHNSGYDSPGSSSSSSSATASAQLMSSPPGSPPGAQDIGIVYTSTLNLDIALPMHKRTFLPTFHSCLASRVYTLQLSVTMVPATSTSSSSKASTTVGVTVPLQIVVEATERTEDKEGLPTFEAALEEAEADVHLQPRVLVIPDTRYQETNTLPGYRG